MKLFKTLFQELFVFIMLAISIVGMVCTVWYISKNYGNTPETAITTNK